VLVSAPAKGLKPVNDGKKAQHDAAATTAERQRNGVAPQSDGGFWPSRFAPALGLAAAPALPCGVCVLVCVFSVVLDDCCSAVTMPAHAPRARADVNEKSGVKEFQNKFLMQQLPENEQ